MDVARWLGRAPVALLLTLAVLQAPAVAEPKPTVAQARARLVKLNERADQLVERFNQATEAYKKAKSRHDRLGTSLRTKRAQVDALRADLISVAVTSYQTGGLEMWQSVALPGDPGAMLSRLATIDQMAQAQTEALRVFDVTTQQLRGRLDDAKAALAEADAARDKVRKERTKVERLVAQQTALLRRLGAFNPGKPDSVGQIYTGPASGDARTALEFAYKQIGKPYRYGGTGPDSFDCSGFVQASWAAAGVSLPRTTYQQWAWGARRRVSLDKLEPGDLVFSRGLGHMGMYAGDGKMIHSPQTGDVVKVVDIDDYWRGRLIGAVRP